MHITQTITQHIDMMHTGLSLTIYFPIGTTHPYEGIGKQALQDVYARCKYKVQYGSKPGQDVVAVYKRR